MSRLLSLVMVLAGLGFATPAAAMPSVTVAVSQSTLVHGSSVTFTGRTVGAERGALVKLQRKAAAGWRTVAWKKVGAARAYRFTTTPRKGYQHYRVLRPRQLGQPSAMSRVVRLRVEWSPTVTLDEHSDRADIAEGSITTTTRGRTTGVPAGTQLRREVLQGGTWSPSGWVNIGADHGWNDSFASEQGWLVRYTAPALGPRLRASSSSLLVDGSWTPTITVGARMDELTDDVTVSGTSIGVAPGSTVRRQFQVGDSWYVEGAPVSVAEDGTFVDTFDVTMHRSYRYAVPEEGLRHAATSSPFTFADTSVVRASLNTTTYMTLPAGATQRTLKVQLAQDQTFTYASHDDWATVSVTDPSGEVLPGFDSDPRPFAVTAVAPLSGDYTFTISADSAPSQARGMGVILSTPVVVPTTLDAAGEDLAGELPGQVVDLVFTAAGGSVISEYSPIRTNPAYSRESVALLDPTGAVVPTWGQTLREGENWRLPAVSGEYTLRIRPTHTNLVDRKDQAVLSAQELTAVVDGEPAHVVLDRPGQVAVVNVTVPAGLALRLSDTQPSHMREDLFGPDGQRITSNELDPRLDPTHAGTYTQLVSYEFADATEADYYASTPKHYDTGGESTLSFDLGPAPARQATIKIPVTAGALFSVEILDAQGQPCFQRDSVESGAALLGWTFYGGQHPTVIKVAESGDVAIGLIPCTPTGTLRLVPTEVASSTVTSITPDENGYITTTTDGTIAATLPGQVMILEYDAGPHASNRIEVRQLSSSFPAGTTIALAHATPDSYYSRGFSNGSTYPLPVTLYEGLRGLKYILVYAGPTATGALALEFERLDMCCFG